MSKHVHPISFRLVNSTKYKISKKAFDFYNKNHAFLIKPNLTKDLYSIQVIEKCFIERVLLEFFRKNNFLVDSIKIARFPFSLQISSELFLRWVSPNNPNSTNLPLLSINNQQTFIENNALYTSLSFFEDFFENLLFKGNNIKIRWDLRFFSLVLFESEPFLKDLQNALSFGQKKSFFHNTLGLFMLIANKPFAELFVQFIITEFTQVKNHQIFLDFIALGFTFLINDKSTKLKACILKVKGRLNGSDRTSTFLYKQGPMPLQTVTSPVNFSAGSLNTKYGVLKVSLYLLYSVVNLNSSLSNFMYKKNRRFLKYRKGSLKVTLSSNQVKKTLKASQFSLKYGEFGLVSTHSARFSEKQVEISRRILSSHLKKIGRYWIRSFPDLPVTKKPIDSRMGKGKGLVSFWCAHLTIGQVLIEVSSIEKRKIVMTLRKVARKLPFPTKIVERSKIIPSY